MATAAPPLAGYSSKSLPEKLGFKPGMSVGFVALPESLSAAGGNERAFNESNRRRIGRSYRAIQPPIMRFTPLAYSAAEIESGLGGLQAAIKRDGMIWISWPKKAAGIAQRYHRKLRARSRR